MDAATREYLVRLTQHIQAHWSLPDLINWDDNLLSVMIIRVKRGGAIADMKFEKRSENMYFNQLVKKTLTAAAPMPPFPPALKEQELEVGLRFSPGSVF